MIVDALLNSLAGDAPVRQIVVGAHLTVVCSRGCGLASTLTGHPHRRQRVSGAGTLHERGARALAELIRSDSPVEASIGLAAINSLLDAAPAEALARINGADYLAEHGRHGSVALIGHFPFVASLRPRVGRLWVIELDPEEGDYPASAAADLLPRADAVGITASTLVNHTLDDLLARCRPGVPVVLIGPSTPLSPVLFAHGATMLAGVSVVDEPAVLRTVSQGASFQQVSGAWHVGWPRPTTPSGGDLTAQPSSGGPPTTDP